MVRAHVDEIENDLLLSRKSGIGRYGPRRQMNASRDAQAEGDSKEGTTKREAEVGREKKYEDQQSGFNQVDRLLEQMRPRDDSEQAVFGSVGSRQTGRQNQRRPNSTDEEIAKSGDRGVGAKYLRENFTD